MIMKRHLATVAFTALVAAPVLLIAPAPGWTADDSAMKGRDRGELASQIRELKARVEALENSVGQMEKMHQRAMRMMKEQHGDATHNHKEEFPVTGQ